MTGDWVNDVPARKAVDIGFAMSSGTKIAEEGGKMILADNSFVAIVGAGWAICNNNTAFVCDLLTCNIGNVFTAHQLFPCADLSIKDDLRWFQPAPYSSGGLRSGSGQSAY
jgi:magnesium-transporting ATPase (P-type)